MNHTQTTRPQSATEILKLAGNTLGERSKQYDPAAKQERSMPSIVAAFNAIYPTVPLTVHMGWQFMSLVKMVRGATKPHADSALDQVAYAALAAEEVAREIAQQDRLHEEVGRVATACSAIPERTITSAYSYTALELAGVSEDTFQQRMEALMLELQKCKKREYRKGLAYDALYAELQACKAAQGLVESPIAHNTDEAADLKQKPYVDPFDQYGDTQPLASKPRIVGDADPRRGGLAYPNGKPL